MEVDDLIGRNRRLLKRAEAIHVLTRQIIEEVSETHLIVHLTLLRTVLLGYGGSGHLAEMICLRRCSCTAETAGSGGLTYLARC